MSSYPELKSDVRRGPLTFPPIPIARERDRFERREVALSIGERLFAILLLAALFPCLLVVSFIVFLLSRRSPLIAHARVGRGGREIWVLKLRTMWGGTTPNGAGHRGWLVERVKGDPPPEVKRSHDPRITSGFAAACRKYSLDELPQLWHVARGDLSLVGPRPMTAGELADHYGTAAAEILRLPPGLTGLWQVRGRSRLNYRQRRRLDLFLVRRWSLKLYFGILLRTVPKVLRGADAW